MPETIDDVRLPTSLSSKAIAGPAFSTSQLRTAGGAVRRNRNWAFPLRRFTVGTRSLTAAQMAAFRAFFLARGGPARGFRFRDPTDYVLSRQAIGSTDGSTAAFQVFKRYTSGGVNHDRVLTYLVSGSVSVWVNGNPITAGGGAGQYQVNLLTGGLTLGATLAATTGQAVEAACEFDLPAFFAADSMPVSTETVDYQDWGDVLIEELRL